MPRPKVAAAGAAGAATTLLAFAAAYMRRD